MNSKKLDKEKILQKLESLPDSYWIEHFKHVEQGRQDKVDDILAELLYLFDMSRERLTEIITSNYDRTETRLTRTEAQKIRTEISGIEDRLKGLGLAFDKDINKQAKGINTRTMRFDALKVRILAELNALYAEVGNDIYNHIKDVTDYFYASTIYEVFKTAGYGSKDINKLSDSELAEILAIIWRSTDEAFDDVVWRYGRTFVIELQQLIGRSRFMDTTLEDLLILIDKMYQTKLNELNRLVRTDSTYYSILGEKQAFSDLYIDEAVFTAILDERTSDMCREADGNVIAVEDIEPWVNAPPLHFSCRSSLTPIVKQVDWLTGEVYEVKGDFDGWYTTWE